MLSIGTDAAAMQLLLHFVASSNRWVVDQQGAVQIVRSSAQCNSQVWHHNSTAQVTTMSGTACISVYLIDTDILHSQHWRCHLGLPLGRHM